jgi:hypothetical protein
MNCCVNHIKDDSKIIKPIYVYFKNIRSDALIWMNDMNGVVFGET